MKGRYRYRMTSTIGPWLTAEESGNQFRFYGMIDMKSDLAWCVADYKVGTTVSRHHRLLSQDLANELSFELARLTAETLTEADLPATCEGGWDGIEEPGWRLPADLQERIERWRDSTMRLTYRRLLIQRRVTTNEPMTEEEHEALRREALSLWEVSSLPIVLRSLLQVLEGSNNGNVL